MSDVAWFTPMYRASEGAPVAAVTPVADITFQEDAATRPPESEAIAPPALASVSTGTGGTRPSQSPAASKSASTGMNFV